MPSYNRKRAKHPGQAKRLQGQILIYILHTVP